MLIGMEFVLEILETSIATAYVKGSIPSSVILVGPSGAGKSQALLLYAAPGVIPSIHHSDDLTGRGIEDIVTSDPENKTTHILCPDFNVPLSHKDSVVALTSAKLMTLMSDGVVRIDDGRSKKEVKHRPTGILTAMTNRIYSKVSKKWDMLGFKRRFIPVFFQYSAATQLEIQESIRQGRPAVVTIKRNPLPKVVAPAEVKIMSKESRELEMLSAIMAHNLSYHPARDRKTGKLLSVPGEDFLPFSPHHVLRTMASGHALLRNRRIVTAVDVDFCKAMTDFCKYGHPVSI